MATKRWFVTAVLLVAMLAAGTVGPATATGGPFTDVVVTAYGAYNGISYVRYEGQFGGTAPGGPYSVLFQVIAPADPALSNGVLVMEPFHQGNLAAGLGTLTPDLLFTGRFMYAGLNWYRGPDPGLFNPLVDLRADLVADAAAIISDFVAAIRSQPQGTQMVGTVQRIYATGLSRTSQVMHAVLHTDKGPGLFDLALLNTPRWYKDAHAEPSGIGKVMVIITEAELAADALQGQHSVLLRGSSPTYRCYEFAGSAHIPDNAYTRSLYGALVAGTNPLDWMVASRALFMAGHYWVTRGIELPPSMAIASAAAGEIDAVYGVETGIARDEIGNALGGVRLPDLAIGRGQYIAMNPASLGGLGLVGSFVDMKCDLLPDGTPRFPTQGSYVSQFAQVAEDLVADRFLLQADATALIVEAAHSELCKHKKTHLPAMHIAAD